MPKRAPAVPLVPIGGILDLFRTHDIVFIGDAHRNVPVESHLLSLIQDPRFPDVVNDIVVESGNSLYQDVMDRYTRGEQVPDADLRLVWRNTTVVSTIWESPIREAAYRAIRSANAARPKSQQVRVLLGDPPVDWQRVQSAKDLSLFGSRRDSEPTAIIEREVMAKKRRALVVYGIMHFQRRNLFTNYETQDGIAESIEAQHPGSTFTIFDNIEGDVQTLQPDAAGWPKPSLVKLKGTVLGAADFLFYFPHPGPREGFRDGKPDPAVLLPRDQYKTLRMEDQFDAILYYGPPSALTTTQVSSTLCEDSAYIRTLLARIALIGGAPSEVDRLRKLCPALVP